MESLIRNLSEITWKNISMEKRHGTKVTLLNESLFHKTGRSYQASEAHGVGFSRLRKTEF
jgi:hypothetical protein